MCLGFTHNTYSQVGIGTENPTATLHVEGNIKIKDRTEGAGKILTSDINGKAE